MDGWNTFAQILAQIDPALNNAVNIIITALVAYIAPVLQIGIAVVLAGDIAVRSFGSGEGLVTDLGKKLAGAAVVYALATSLPNYNGIVRDFFLTALPTSIDNAIVGATGAHVIDGGAFDAVAGKAYLAGLVVWRQVAFPYFSLILVAIYWIVAYIAIAIGFIVWLLARVLLVLFVATGPLFVATAMIPVARDLAARWVSAMISAIVLQVFSVALLTLLITAENALVLQISNAMTAGGGLDNEAAMLKMLLAGMILFVVSGVIAAQLPGAAASVSHGVHLYAGNISSAIYSRVTQVSQRAGGATASAATSAVSAARARVFRTPGAALGGGSTP